MACLRRGDKKMIELRKIDGDNIDEAKSCLVENLKEMTEIELKEIIES